MGYSKGYDKSGDSATLHFAFGNDAETDHPDGKEYHRGLRASRHGILQRLGGFFRSLVPGMGAQTHPRVSPDGKWLAYQSHESGQVEIYVRPFPNAGARVQVSNQGGTEPLWAQSGRLLYYRTPTGLVAVTVTTGTTFSLGDRRTVIPDPYERDGIHANYDVAPDGTRFLMLKPAGEDARAVIVHNWGRELRDKLAAGKK